MRFITVTLMWAAVAGAVFAFAWMRERQLLMWDPSSVPAHSALIEFATVRGAALFAVHCAGCHGSRGEADPVRGIPDLADGDWLYGKGSVPDIEQVVKFGIRSHHPKSWNLALMPAYASARPSAREPRLAPLKPREIHEVVEYLIALEGAPADATLAAHGARVFAGAAGCYDCHAADAKGDSALGAPNLTDGITLYGDGSRASLWRSIAGGRQGVCPAFEARLRPAAIRELAVFVYALAQPRRSAP